MWISPRACGGSSWWVAGQGHSGITATDPLLLRNSGFRGPLVRVVINLDSADLSKEGPFFSLPIALALLVARVGLDGSLRLCRG